MPIPILIALGAVAVKAAAVLKTGAVVMKGGAVAAKGTAVLAKAFAGKGAFVARTMAHAAHTYGVAQVATFAVVTTMTVGVAALLYERAERLLAALDRGDVGDALLAASALSGDLRTAGGLTDIADLLNRFVSEHGTSASTVADVVGQVSGLFKALGSRLGR